MKPGDLLDIAVRNEAHTLVIGRPGAGKTSLVRIALAQNRKPALVFDYVGNYRGFVDYYGVYPVNPLEFVKPQDFIDALAKVILVAYGYANAMSPAMEEVLLTAFEESAISSGEGEEGPEYSIPHALQWLFTEGPGYFRNADELAALRGARRRLNELANNILFARRTHPVLGDWLDGKLNAQLGIRLRGFSLKQVLLYVTTLLTIMARREVEAGDWRFVVVDEAQYFAGVEGISPLEEAVRIARNYGFLFIAITQNARAIPERMMDVFKVIVDFRRSSTPRKALVEVYVTDPELARLARVSRADEEPVLRDFVDVDVRSLNALKRRGVDWFECLSRANLEDSIKRRYIYYKARVAGKWVDRIRDLSDYPELWDCMSNYQRQVMAGNG
ncbi:hypothetical protein [Vulcanisaeta souniana]|uniref:Uncharacterized protein n=1 Tax=Vulcanisaeta souniana JCM 11219 TaxID=1293586 RepID=A0A830EMV8_9CREN|nr:hypothetical protein [Vulcanisaeta souniana]BDR92266.1 hypothetical protein Vsou_13590 [Vulcanisaeta souniana JCM 11219]GGI86352.1 hypothetical protein GCM10007112_24170 [Vulcanisaeta souniana JCM 11219]